MNMQDDTPRHAPLLFALVLLVTGLFYLPGVNGPWMHDDYGRITTNEEMNITREQLNVAALAHSAALYPERPLPMMSFAAVHALCGESTACQKVPNVVLHLATGVALFFLLSLLARVARQRGLAVIPGWLPLAASALWVVHPLNVSTTLYVVQRMTVMATLFMFLALIAWVQARTAAGSGARIAWLTGAVVCTLLGYLCKESALLVPVFIVLGEVLLMPPAVRARIPRPALLGALAALAFVALLAVLVLFPPHVISASYATRDFTPVERLLTESRILVYYASEVLYPDQSRMSLYLDVFPLSHSLLDPPSTLASVLLCVGALVAASAMMLRRASLVAFGILLFFAGHLLESTVYGLILTYEHRNYLPSLGLIIAVCGVIALLPRPAATVPALVFALFIANAVELRERSSAWGSEDGFAGLLESPRWQDSSLAQGELAMYYARLEERNADNRLLAGSYNRKANQYYLRSAQLTTQNFMSLAYLVVRPVTPEIRAQAWDMLDDSAEHAALDANAINATNWMVTCALAPVCPIDRQRLANVLDRFLANPRYSPLARVMIQRAAGSFYVRAYGDPDKGIALSYEAAKSGRADARESLIKNLSYLGRMEEAKAAYEALEHDVELNDDQRDRIDAAMGSAGTAAPPQPAR